MRGFGRITDWDDAWRAGYVLIARPDRRTPAPKVRIRYANGHFIDNDGDEPVFTGKQMFIGGQQIRLPMPNVRDFIVLEYEQTHTGLQASKWGYARIWHDHLTALKDRPVYRLVSHPPGTTEPQVHWEGKNIARPSVLWPKAEIPVRGQKVVEDMLFAGGSFEQLVDGQWQPSEDPRIFLCCVPKLAYRKYASQGSYQPYCHHGNRH